MLDDSPHVFEKHRTARSLLMHWLDRKDYNLVSNQSRKKPKVILYSNSLALLCLSHITALEYNSTLSMEDFEEITCEFDDDSDDDIDSESVLLELRTEERWVEFFLIKCPIRFNIYESFFVVGISGKNSDYLTMKLTPGKP